MSQFVVTVKRTSTEEAHIPVEAPNTREAAAKALSQVSQACSQVRVVSVGEDVRVHSVHLPGVGS